MYSKCLNCFDIGLYIPNYLSPLWKQVCQTVSLYAFKNNKNKNGKCSITLKIYLLLLH